MGPGRRHGRERGSVAKSPPTGAHDVRGLEGFEARVLDALPALYATALRLTRNETDAEDLVSDAVTRAWEKRDRLHDPGAFRGWIFRILTNAFLSERRRRESRAAHASLVETGEEEATFVLFDKLHQPVLLWWGSPEQDFLDRLLRQDLEQALESIPETFRLAVLLVDVQGFSYREAAEILEVPIGTVRSRLARGRSLLQKSLWAHGADAGLVAPDDTRAGETT
jgi:RNA polymerase sigma factor (sigma-70 family)